MESQRISAEIVAGFFLCTAYRICSDIYHSQDVTHRVNGVQCDVTRSLCCVWLASNIKFLIFRSKKNPVSLSEHSLSRLIAFLALLVNACFNPRPSGEQLPILDLALCSFFILSSVTHLVADRSRFLDSVDLRKAMLTPRRLFFQVDVFATFVFGLLWLAYPDWLLPVQYSMGSEEALHLHLTRAFGAMMVGESSVSFTGQNFNSSKNSTSVFIGRAVGTLALLIFMVHSQLTTSAWTTSRICFSTVGAGLWTGNSILGYLSTKNLS
ncbi:hypothetical protein JZ751_001265 [Albula glossodonta]|uniref:Uncharacterized protein n=1 Tax=Albula glossodonta TaxID=121402 RepID=A0A8T2PT75_9TELE|nr:hypothetical protein JZ751_001265 [Albula glossodonta]